MFRMDNPAYFIECPQLTGPITQSEKGKIPPALEVTMRPRVISVADPVQQRFEDNGFKPYLEAFRLDCTLRNLSPKTTDVYPERLSYLFSYLQRAGISLEKVNREIIKIVDSLKTKPPFRLPQESGVRIGKLPLRAMFEFYILVLLWPVLIWLQIL
jgi:hypothetical protein